MYQTEKQVKEMGDKLSSEDKGKIEAALGRLKEAQKGSNIEEIKSALDGVNSTWNEIAQKMYAQGQGPDQQGAPGAQPGAEQQSEKASAGEKEEEKVEDADYEVVDEDDKKKKK